MNISISLVWTVGRVKKNFCLMMMDRGYELDKEEENLCKLSELSIGSHYLNKALEEKKSFRDVITQVYEKSSEKTLSLFLDANYDESKKREKMISSDYIKSSILKWKNDYQNCAHCILISPGRLSPDAKREILIPNLVLLNYDFLMVPIGRHSMVPRHIGLSKEDATKFLETRKIIPMQLPQLKKTDPVSIYYGFHVGTIVKIIRPGGVVHFRIVVDS
jgi:DNA-directed RNA polymerase subunit H (RpoH/RPB5)